MAMVPVEVRSFADQSVLGTVDLPLFCIDHMKMTPPELNLTTMIKHIESRIHNLKVGEVYVKNEKRTGITAEEIGASGISLTVKPL
jgi:hypothetical protein